MNLRFWILDFGMKPRWCFVLIMLFAFSLNSTAKNSAADDLYKKNQFSDAAAQYELMLKKNPGNPTLLYNLGNAYYKTGEYGKAVLNYRRCLRVDPMNEDAAFNLSLANLHTIDKIEADEDWFGLRWLKNISAWIGIRSAAVFCLVLLFFSLGAFACFLFLKKLFLRRVSFWSSAFSFFLALMFFSLSWYANNLNNRHDEAVITAASVHVKSSPDPKSTDLFMLHEGTEIRVLDTVGIWNKIILANGQQGWVRGEELEKI